MLACYHFFTPPRFLISGQSMNMVTLRGYVGIDFTSINLDIFRLQQNQLSLSGATFTIDHTIRSLPPVEYSGAKVAKLSILPWPVLLKWYSSQGPAFERAL